MQLTEEEDQNDILMIGGISIFLPFAQRRQKIVLQMVQTTEEQSQLMMTVKEERIGADFETAQAEMKEENEHSGGMIQQAD
jgi:hypothetical protein